MCVCVCCWKNEYNTFTKHFFIFKHIPVVAIQRRLQAWHIYYNTFTSFPFGNFCKSQSKINMFVSVGTRTEDSVIRRRPLRPLSPSQISLQANCRRFPPSGCTARLLCLCYAKGILLRALKQVCCNMSLVMCECFEMIKECLWSWFYIQTANLTASATLCLQAAKGK